MKCTGKTKDDQPCRNHAGGGSKLCFFHNPAVAKQRRKAQAKGGSNRSHLEVMPTPPFDLDLEDPRKIPKLLTFLANGLVRGQFDTKLVYAVGFLADCAMRAHKAGELTERVAEMERLLRVEQATPYSAPSDSTIQFEDEGEEPVEP